MPTRVGWFGQNDGRRPVLVEAGIGMVGVMFGRSVLQVPEGLLDAGLGVR